ncbi:MAG TPA: pyridoxamine 5'-phosphate oxidase family protein [Bryobacteraceae bacterium]|nr:pyridoxamine 5'-phosphate oxidase family protein [Bryobacteraceae bacterium]
MEQRTNEENVRKLGELIKGIRVAMFTTIEPDGSLRSRPMYTQDVEFDGQLWFFTWLDTAKVSEISREQHVNVSYSSPSDERYVSLSGRARLVQDPAKAKELWNPALKAWFPKGLDDPNLGLILVDAEKAEYWDSPSSKLVQMIGFAKAVTTGKSYADEATDHQRVKL